MEINLHNKQFKSLSNSANGEVSDATLFHYHQEGNMIWAEYKGGQIIKGFLLGTKVHDRLNFNYQHLNDKKELMTGKCETKIALNKEGKVLLHESWQWTSGDFSKGNSTLIEI